MRRWRKFGRLSGMLLATAALSAETTPPLPPTGTIELFQSDRRVLAMMRIGDGELVPMVFDTGSDGHSFDRLLVTRNRLRTVGETIEVDGTTGKRRTLPRIAVPDATVGGLRVGRIEGVALDYDRNDAMGIFSPEAFAGRLVTLDLGANRAVVKSDDPSQRPSGTAQPYEGGLPAVAVTLPSGTRILANFDTGFDAPLSLPVAMMNTVPLKSPARVVGRFRSINTEGEVWGGRVDGDVAIGPLVLHDPEVTFLGEITNIGLPAMRRLVITLDPARKQAWTRCAAVC